MIETRRLPVKLTELEIRERGEELAKTIGEITALETSKKQSADSFKGQISTKEIRRDELAGVVTTRTEYREVEVREEKSYSDGIARIYRRDTGEEVETRTLSKSEMEAWRQGKLDLDVDVTLTPAPTLPMREPENR